MKEIPQHIAIIMDGNGRWAKKRGLPRVAGHKVGADSLKDIVKACAEIGVKYLTVYAFSTENWERPKEEVDFLMGLFSDSLKNRVKEIASQLNAEYKDKNPVFIGVLNGAFLFMADLFRNIETPCEVSFIRVSS